MRVHCIRTAQETRPLFHVNYRCPWIRVKPKRIHLNNGLPLPIIKDGLFFPVRSRSCSPCVRLLNIIVVIYYYYYFKFSFMAATSAGMCRRRRLVVMCFRI